ncbi:adenylyltransferase [Haloglomus irregulare]|jgi:adenylyltransferase/sulfurtransferase|uniref:Adenylyltransferase n=1 Tax=Haloglomus irregulare TaxID=2234134 RepID=A0A554NC49_9EURY|nr:molybdopterin-synthase adenylyltransferase MoeB [Haloglomus irregulare]TSD14590.1 adenylyltransferase [Haloglomus irregulare]
MSLDLTPEQLDRYSRHVIMDEVGPEGQGRLLDARVLCIGAGGLGSPVIQYLAAAGVGSLGIADDDVVERSNLQRQVIHGDPDVGRPKVVSARDFVARQNPDIDVEPHETRVTAENVGDLVADYDLVVDGSDNFATRYLVNDACTLAGVPFVHGAILRFEGQMTTFEATTPVDDPDADNGPCYRCLFPEAPEPGTVPDCATAGVLGVLPGTVGCVMATEAVKLLLDHGDSLDGRMVFYDAEDMTFREIQVEPRPDCPVCQPGGVESVAEVDYRESCAIE